MQRSLFALAPFCAVVLGLSACAPKSAPQSPLNVKKTQGIVGGTDITAEEDPIAQVTGMLFIDGRSSLCTVSILNEHWVLTAGHCAEGRDVAKLEVVFEVNPGDTGERVNPANVRRVAEAKVNPKFPETMKALEDLVAKAQSEGREIKMDDIDAVKDWGDVALLRLETAIPASRRPATLLPEGTKLVKGQTVKLAGYGITTSYFGFGVGSGTLRQVEVKIEEPIWGTTEILFNQRDGKGACHGDSGGPAYVALDGQLYLFGVTSRGVADSQDTCQQLAAYTNIESYRQWVREIVGL